MENTERMIFPGVVSTASLLSSRKKDIRIDKLEWIPVNYALTAKDKATKGVHFYKDDYQFERFWNNPDKYISLLQQFGAVCSPDFSLYSDMPLAVQLFMHYKKHWLAAYWQAHGIHVIPTLCWCGEQSYDWCFDGEPRNAIVSISSTAHSPTHTKRNALPSTAARLWKCCNQAVFCGTANARRNLTGT